jgi:hypothetical protein
MAEQNCELGTDGEKNSGNLVKIQEFAVHLKMTKNQEIQLNQVNLTHKIILSHFDEERGDRLAFRGWNAVAMKVGRRMRADFRLASICEPHRLRERERGRANQLSFSSPNHASCKNK